MRIPRYTYLTCLLLAGSVSSAQGAEFPQEGLVLWLDASDASSIVADRGEPRVLAWHDKSRRKLTLQASEGGAVRRIQKAVAGRDALQFDGTAFFHAPSYRNQIGEVSVLVVSVRPPEMAGEDSWQRLVSSLTEEGQADTDAPSFCVVAGEEGAAHAYQPVVDEKHLNYAVLGKTAIGASAANGGQKFRGYLCEVLIYDRNFTSEKQINAVRQYLAKKWHARLACYDEGWTRIGLLENVPRRINNDFPLSDQENQGGWIKQDAFSDEFDGTTLDADKWWPRNPTWLGREPAYFYPGNVTASDGNLHLTFRKQEVPEMPKDQGYHTYTSASVVSKKTVKYGYFEIRAKPMRSAGSSAFWFLGSEGPWKTEIDVFELGGGAVGFERKYNMNLHVFETPQEKRHWNTEGTWLAPWDLVDDYHVYGLEWDANTIVYYVDGVLVRRVDNTHWHNQMKMIFDSEAMFDWLGVPKDEDLPSNFSIDYVRAWQREKPVAKDSAGTGHVPSAGNN